jgi:hypothetical protein
MDDHESINGAIKRFKAAYGNLKWGIDWKSELTCDSVYKLENLDYSSIIEKIVGLTPSESQLYLAFMFAETLTEIIFDAENNAFKLVNGSLGEWCPNAGNSIWKMFHAIYNSYNNSPDFMKRVEHIRNELDYYGSSYDWKFS